jgi:hypothetical protein
MHLESPWILPSGVGVGFVYGASSLILIPIAFLPTTFLHLADGSWEEVA